MAHTKAKSTTKLGRDSESKRLGVKLSGGQTAIPGNIIVRQRGAKIMAGRNVAIGKDHTLYAKTDGIVKFGNKRKTNYHGKNQSKKIVHVELTKKIKITT